MFNGFKFIEELKVGMKFRVKGLCETCDFEIIEINGDTVVTRSLMHPDITKHAFSNYDENGYGIVRRNISKFLNETHPERCRQLIPYNGDSRY